MCNTKTTVVPFYILFIPFIASATLSHPSSTGEHKPALAFNTFNTNNYRLLTRKVNNLVERLKLTKFIDNNCYRYEDFLQWCLYAHTFINNNNIFNLIGIVCLLWIEKLLVDRLTSSQIILPVGTISVLLLSVDLYASPYCAF